MSLVFPQCPFSAVGSNLGSHIEIHCQSPSLIYDSLSFLSLPCHIQRVLVIYFVENSSIWVCLIFFHVRHERQRVFILGKDVTEVMLCPSQCVRWGTLYWYVWLLVIYKLWWIGYHGVFQVCKVTPFPTVINESIMKKDCEITQISFS